MTVAEMIAALYEHADSDPDAEVFVVTSSNGHRIDGRVEIETVGALPLLGGALVLAVVPRYAVAGHRALIKETSRTLSKTQGS